MSTYYVFRHCVSDPTTDYGSALDHIYSNQFNMKTEIDFHDVYYSNHDAVFISVDQSEKKLYFSSPELPSYRFTSNNIFEKLLRD